MRFATTIPPPKINGNALLIGHTPENQGSLARQRVMARCSTVGDPSALYGGMSPVSDVPRPAAYVLDMTALPNNSAPEGGLTVLPKGFLFPYFLMPFKLMLSVDDGEPQALKCCSIG
jgi:hypothetical protein